MRESLGGSRSRCDQTGGGSSRLLRRINERAALGCLFLRGPLTRPELVELTGFSKPTASEVVKRLRAADLVTVTGRTSGGPGPRAERYAINPDACYGAAISVREPDRLDIVIGDLAGAERFRDSHRLSYGELDIAEALAAEVRQACQQAAVPVDKLHQLWIAVPGSFDARTDRVRNIDVPGFDRTGLRRRLANDLDLCVHIDNDVNLATLAERRHGIGGTDGFVLLWLGERGIGLGIDLGGALLHGFRGAAGELGYLSIGAPGAAGRAILTDLIGGPAIMELSRIAGRATGTAVEAVHAAVAAGDTEFVTAVTDRIVSGLSAVAAVLDPAVIVLAGEVGLAGGETLRSAVSEALGHTAFGTRVATSTIARDAVLRGGLDAAQAALREGLLSESNPDR